MQSALKRNNQPLRVLSFMWRDLRNSKKIFLLGTIGISTASFLLTAIFAATYSLNQSFVKDQQALLGGDLLIRSSNRNFTLEHIDWLTKRAQLIAQSLDTQSIISSANSPQSQLVRIRFIDNQYPIYGTLAYRETKTSIAKPVNLQSIKDAQSNQEQLEVWPAIIHESTAKELKLKIGDQFSIFGFKVEVKDIYNQEPDPNPRALSNSPSLFIPYLAIKQTKLLEPGNVVNRRILLKLQTDDTFYEVKSDFEDEFADNSFSFREPNQAFSGLRRGISTVQSFLLLAAVGAIIIAGIGALVTTNTYLRMRIRTIGTLKMLGTSDRTCFFIYLCQIVIFVTIGCWVGLFLGYGTVSILLPLFTSNLPTNVEVSLPAYLLAFIAIITPLAIFALSIANIDQRTRTNPKVLFQPDISTTDMPAKRFWMIAISIGIILCSLSVILFAGISTIFAFSIVITPLVLIGIAKLLLWSLPKIITSTNASITWIYAVRNIIRNHNVITLSIISIGTAIFTIMAMAQIEHNLNAGIKSSLKARLPDFFFINLQTWQIDDFFESMTDLYPYSEGQKTPQMQGRLVKFNGSPIVVEDIPESSRWIVRRERGLTWSEDDTIIGGSKVVQGKMWDDQVEGLQVSFDQEAAEDFNLSIGDTIELSILGKIVKATITNLREINWQSFDVNYVMVFNEQPLNNAPFSYFAKVDLLANDPELREASTEDYDPLFANLSQNFPNVNPINVKLILGVLQRLLTRSSLLIQAVAGILLLIGLLTIAISIIEDHQSRLRATVVLRLLGTKKKFIWKSTLLEFLILGIITCVPAWLAGNIIGAWVVHDVFSLDFTIDWGFAFPLLALVLIVILLGSSLSLLSLLKQNPLALVRNE